MIILHSSILLIGRHSQYAVTGGGGGGGDTETEQVQVGSELRRRPEPDHVSGRAAFRKGRRFCTGDRNAGCGADMRAAAAAA